MRYSEWAVAVGGRVGVVLCGSVGGSFEQMRRIEWMLLFEINGGWGSRGGREWDEADIHSIRIQ